MAKQKYRYVYKDAVDGKFISAKEAAKRPREAMKMRVSIRKPTGKKKK